MKLEGRGLAACVVVTLGPRVPCSSRRLYDGIPRVPPVHVVSTIGSGDAFLGGLVGALTGGWQETLRDAVVIRFLSPEAPPRR